MKKFTSDYICHDCGVEMEIVEGEISPAMQMGGDIKDAEWGKWYECPDCHTQEDL